MNNAPVTTSNIKLTIIKGVVGGSRINIEAVRRKRVLPYKGYSGKEGGGVDWSKVRGHFMSKLNQFLKGQE